ncbi:hypothetical protein HHI36_013898 [Cryptolaemus montrouzieri]|uniref:RING-type domain-containing protein n=1 Tax=Cryptolaemus montrouzieri TaxID=559131 RepID=A0ABD2N194_9CUCU
MLEFDQNEIILLCLPPYTTHYLQPLDKPFFKSLKTFYYDEKLLSKLEESEPELAGCQEEECVICIHAKATMETVPCGHKVVCRKCFVKTIQIAVSQRLLPLRCVICRAKVLRLRTGPALPSSASGYSVNSRASSVPQSDSLYSVSSGGSSISSNSSASECGAGNHVARGGVGGGCCGGRCLGAYPRQPATGAIRRSQQHSMKMRLQDYCRPERVNRLPPIRELPGQSPSHSTPPASTRIRCAQKIVTQLESVSLLGKKKYERLPQDDEEEDEEEEKALLIERDKKWWSDSKWLTCEDKSEERSDNKKNEIVEKQMEMREKGKSFLKRDVEKGKSKMGITAGGK